MLYMDFHIKAFIIIDCSLVMGYCFLFRTHLFTSLSHFYQAVDHLQFQ